jgi:hypothetical protein
MLVCVFFLPLHARPRVQRAPGFPCALSVFCEGGDPSQNPGASRRGNAGAWPRVVWKLNRKPNESEIKPAVKPVIACDKRGAFAQGSLCDEAIQLYQTETGGRVKIPSSSRP